MTLPPPLSSLPDHFRFSEARDLGWTRALLDQALDDGEVVWLRQGWYGVPRPRRPLESWEQDHADHRDRLALELRRRPGHAASHTSGAVLRSLAVSISPLTPVDLTTIDRVPRSCREPGLVVHRSTTLLDDTEVVDGLRVTTLARTVADFLRMRTLPHGLALLDDALRRELIDIPQVRQVLDQQVRWKGRPRALGVLSLADPSRESWAESFSFGHLHLHGIPLPLHQVDVFDEQGRWLGRVDGLWPAHGVVGEVDGVGKYFIADPADARPPEQVVLANLELEQARQQRMESLGLRFVRWTPSEVRDATDRVAVRLNRAFATARPHDFRGYVRWRGEARELPFDVETPTLDPETLRYRRARRRRR